MPTIMTTLLRLLVVCCALLAAPAVAQPASAGPAVEETRSVAAPVDAAPAGAVGQAARFFTHPLVAAVLLTLGFLGLIVEAKTPSFGLAGAAGLAALALFFGSHVMMGLAGWETVVLFAAGLLLVAVEVFILPGMGVAGVLGALAVLASLLLGMTGEAPTAGDFLVAAWVIAGSLAMLGLLVWQIVERLPHDGRMELRASTRREDGYVSSRAREELVGAEGVAETDLHPSGTARFGGERLDVVSEGSFVQAGTPVRLIRADGYRHVVRAIG
jgi:membrane-bound serine protease (ClpP class)